MTKDDSLGRPRCSNCGHDLTALTESPRCPECGKPLVEVLVRDGSALVKLMGKRYTSKATLFGIPAISVAYGIGADGRPGHAKGWLAFGDRATGVVAVGGMAMGGITCGGLSLGVCSVGGMSVGLLGSLGGLAVSPLGLAMGGAAIGLIATGGMAIGIGSTGGFAVGVYGWGPPNSTVALHKLAPRGQGSPEAEAFFDFFSFLLGPPRRGMASMRPMAWGISAFLFLLVTFALPALLVWWRGGDDDPTGTRG